MVEIGRIRLRIFPIVKKLFCYNQFGNVLRNICYISNYTMAGIDGQVIDPPVNLIRNWLLGKLL